MPRSCVHPGHTRRALLLAGTALGAALWSAAPAAAQEAATLTGSINGRAFDDIDANDPLLLDPDEPAVLGVTIVNQGDRPLTIRSVVLVGEVMGLPFFDFSTQVAMEIPPGERRDREYAVDVGVLGDKARGLLPASVAVMDQDRREVASSSFPVDVRGSIFSTYGVFGLLVAAATAVLLVAALVRLATRTLHSNRWYRAVRFGVVGAGVGLTATFTLSATRVLVPNADRWLPLVIVGTLVGLLFGYLTPAPEGAEADDEYVEPPIDLRDTAPHGARTTERQADPANDRTPSRPTL